jgi:hypothetical protein
VASIALALVLSTQISTSAKINAPAKISTAHNQKQPHRLAVKIDVNDPAVMSLALNNVNNVAQHYGEIGQKVRWHATAAEALGGRPRVTPTTNIRAPPNEPLPDPRSGKGQGPPSIGSRCLAHGFT